MKTTISKSTKLAMDASGVHPFRLESSYAETNAQNNLAGRNHFADESTMKAFKSRILESGMSDDGLVFWLVESNRSKPFEPQKNKRFVAFDVFGNVVNGRDEWHKTTAQAFRSGVEWLRGFDANTHTRIELARKAKRDIASGRAIIEALETPNN